MNECSFCKKPIPDNQKFCSEKLGTKCRENFWSTARKIGSGRVQEVLAQANNPQPLPVPAFFNTAKLAGPNLTAANEKASKQDAAILDFFKDHVGMYTPAEVSVFFPQWPITSVRRSITNLTKQGKLRKTSVKRQGAYGMSNFCWTAA